MESLNRVVLDEQETFIDQWHDCYLSSTKMAGFVCTFHLKNKKHLFYGLNDLEELLAESGRYKKDTYLSLNAFQHGSRTAADLRQIRNIGVDIDCYKLHIPVDRAINEVHKLIIAGKIPNPNLLIKSGRGIQLIFAISGGAAPQMAFLSKYITSQFIGELKHLGADSSGTDVTRVFRLPYSINSRNGKQVTVDVWRTLEYNLLELYSYCTPLESRRKPSKKRKGELRCLPSQKGLKSLYSLNSARKDDLDTLVTIRRGNIEKRNVLTYVYAYTVALMLKNKESTLAFALQLNERFKEEQEANEVERTAGRAYDDAMTFFTEFKKRDFKMWYKQGDGIKRPMKTETIIDELDITAAEIKEFATLIDKDEKRRRNTKKKRETRREEGIVERKVYDQEQRNITKNKAEQLRELLDKNPKEKKTVLAKQLGVGRSRLYELLGELQKEK